MHYYFIAGGLLGAYCLLMESLKVHRSYWALLPVITLMAVFVGVRDFTIGTDTENYVEIFAYVPPLHVFLSDFKFGYHGNRMEVGFFLLASTLKMLSVSPSAYLGIISFVSLSAFALAFKKLAHNYFLAFFIFSCSVLFLTLEYNIIRQGIAAGIGLLAFAYLVENRKLLFWGLLVVAFSFHSIALLFLAVVPFRKLKWKMWYLAPLVVLFFIVGFIDVLSAMVFQMRHISVIFWRVFLYLQESAQSLNVISWMVMSSMGLSFFIVYYIDELRENCPNIDFVLTFQVVGLFGLLFSHEMSLLSMRVGYLFLSIEAVLIVALFSLLNNDSTKYVLMFTLGCLVLAKNVFITAQFLSPYDY